MPGGNWRLDITRDIASDKYDSLHATVTTDSADVGAGYHITIKYRAGTPKRLFFKPKDLEHNESLNDIQFLLFIPHGGHAAAALGSIPTDLPIVYDLMSDAINGFIGAVNSGKINPPNKKAQPSFHKDSFADFPAL